MSFFASLSSFSLTQDCFLCDSSSQEILCKACQNDLPLFDTKNACPRCGVESHQTQVCGRCLKRPPPFDSVHAVFTYDFPVTSLITAFKYAAHLQLTDFLGKQLASCAKGIEASCILPLPLHKERMQERGFNQAHELAKIVAKERAIPIAQDLCERIHASAPQVGLPIKARLKNIKNAFHCTRPKITEPILLIDDVMTTGASLAECARTLKLHGAPAVHALVLARTQKRTTRF